MSPGASQTPALSLGLSRNLSSPVSGNTGVAAVAVAIGGNQVQNSLLFAQRGHTARCAPLPPKRHGQRAPAACPKDGRPGEGERLTPDAPHNSERRPPPGNLPPAPRHATPSRARKPKGQCRVPTPAHPRPQHVGSGPRLPADPAPSNAATAAPANTPAGPGPAGGPRPPHAPAQSRKSPRRTPCPGTTVAVPAARSGPSARPRPPVPGPTGSARPQGPGRASGPWGGPA